MSFTALTGFTHGCFLPETLAELLGDPASETERIALQWLALAGKRWRPLLTAAVYEAAGGEPECIRAPVVAVECFHKASLIHDDIQDGDAQRYGTPTVHASIGVPAAINIGDYLLGEGYRLLASAPFDGSTRAAMLLAAARGHRELCLGQGAELGFRRAGTALTEDAVLQIYRRKTAAAFEVSVLVGGIAAALDAAILEQLAVFSQAIGVAYQIQDDLEDFHAGVGRNGDLAAMRPTLFLAAASASGLPLLQSALQRAWQGHPGAAAELEERIAQQGVRQRVEELYRHHRQLTLEALRAITHPGLAGLLRLLLSQMLTD